MISLHTYTRLCQKICFPQQIISYKKIICTRYRTFPTYNFTQQRYKSTQSSPNSGSLLNYLKLQSKCHFTERDSLDLDALLTRAKSVHYDVIAQDGTCSSCKRNFYNMGCISPETFRQFVEFQLDRPEHVGYGTFKTISRDQIRKLLREDMLELEKLVTTIPHSRDIIAVVDQANINRNATSEGRKWCTQNRDKTVEVGRVNSRHTFSVLAYGAFEKTYSVNCRYFFKELDDLYCLYLSLLLPHMPVVYSMDKFSNFIAHANEFVLASGEKGFSGNFEKILSNVQSSSIPSGDREGFYFPSSSFTTHHFIKGGRSSCIRTTPFSESDLRAVEQLSNRNKAVEAANSLQTAIVENMEKLNPVVELAENQKESRNQAVLDWSSIDLKKTLSETVSKTVRAERKKKQLIEDNKHSFIMFGVRDQFLGEGNIWSNEEELAKDLLKEFEVDPQELVKVEKIGQGGNAPIKVTMTNICSVQKVLKNAYHLRGYEDHYNSIFIEQNRTKTQQVALQKLVQKMKKMIKMDPSKKWIIRDGKIVDNGSFRRKETNTRESSCT